MSIFSYTNQINDLKLYKELKKSARRDDLSSDDITNLVAKINEVTNIAGQLLEQIPQTFKQYTNHNILHCRNLIDLMGRFIPNKTLSHLNGLELTILLSSALLHDFGMFVTEQEKIDVQNSPEYNYFLSGRHEQVTAIEEALENNENLIAETLRDSLLAEFFRRIHPERVRVNVQKNLEGKLVFHDIDISPYILDVCESHAWGVYESNNPRHPNKTVSSLSTNKPIYGIPVNLQYLACCLRLADILDFDRSRTPLVVFKNMNFTEDRSWEEWNKHLQVQGWSINESDVMFRTECEHPAFYVAVMEFLDQIDIELSECRRLIVKEAPKGIAERYTLHLPPQVDRTQVEMKDKSYLAGAFKFQLEYERIMKLLMDKSLYPDPSLFLRELLQNSLDACRNREAHAKESGADSLYKARIVVWDYADDPENPRIVFQDNGMGMSRRIVEEYFMRVGRSYYRSPEFDAERLRLKAKGIDLDATSQFGIGILSCFMVADQFEVETYKSGSLPLHITIEGPTKYFVIKLLNEPPRTDFPIKPQSDIDDGPPNFPGTRITIHLRPDTVVNVFQTLETFAVNVDYEITVNKSEGEESLSIPSRKWERREYQINTLSQSLERLDPEAHVGWQPGGFLSLKRDETLLTRAFEELKNILVPSLVRFDKYEFSNHLKGAAWFWLFQSDKGGVCPEKGYLKIQDGISFIKLPELLRYVSAAVTVNVDSSEWKLFLQTLRDHITENEIDENDEEIHNKISPIFDERMGASYRGYGSVRGERFWGLWNDLTVDEKLAACESLELLNEDAPLWFEDSDVINDLVAGTHDWSKRPLRFDYVFSIKNSPQSIALHGTLLSAGFLEWDSLLGESKKLRLLPRIPAVMLVDWRGNKTPTPASNRLFVLSDEAKKASPPFIRACLYHALELPDSNYEEKGWRSWLNKFLHSLREADFWTEVIQEEYERLEDMFGYGVVINGRFSYLSHEQLFETFGKWVPFVNRYRGGNEGLWAYDGGTKLLSAFKLRRMRDDGIWEMDTESRINVSDQTMDKIFLKIEQDILYAY